MELSTLRADSSHMRMVSVVTDQITQGNFGGRSNRVGLSRQWMSWDSSVRQWTHRKNLENNSAPRVSRRNRRSDR